MPKTEAGRAAVGAAAGAVGAAASTTMSGGAASIGSSVGKAGAAASALGASGVAKTGAVFGGGTAVGSAGTAGSAFTAGSAGAAATAGAAGAGATGAASATAGAATAGAASASAGAGAGAGAGGSAGASGGSAAIAGPAAAGAVGVAAVAAVVAVVALTGDEPPPPEEPAAPTTTIVVEAPPSNAPVPYSVESEQTLEDNLLSEVNADRTNLVTIVGIEGEPNMVGQPMTLPSGATIAVAADGSFAYDSGDVFVSLPQGATSTDRFVYTVSDETGWAEEWSAEVTVVGVNDEPELGAAPPPATVAENGTTTLVVTATDPDDGDTLTFTLDGAPPFVSIADSGDGTATITVSPGSEDAGAYELGVTVTDGATPPATVDTSVTVTVQDVVQVPRPELRRVTDELIVLYDFDEGAGTTLGDSSGGAPIDLTITDPDAVTWGPDGLTVNAPTSLTSNGDTSGLVGEITASNELTMEAWVTPATAAQAGPARVVSISSGVTTRNATLGHGPDDGGVADVWTGRVRSTASSENGRPGLSTPTGTATDQLTHVVFTRSAAGEVNVYVDGQRSATVEVVGELSNWEASAKLLLANETTGNRAWLGTYHLVAVFSRALTAAEVTQNYQVGP
ncbi:MAG: LamG-like jellyroll fold domain-containing protein [Acidimicrobiales bacterium]